MRSVFKSSLGQLSKPAISLDFRSGQLDGRVTITRASNTATRTNSSGIVEVVSADTPRFDYNPITLVCQGLLIEEQRENTLLESANITGDLPWVDLRSTISTGATTAPDGTSTAVKIVEDTTASSTHYVGQDVSWVSGATYTISIYAKNADAGRPGVGIWLPSFGDNVRAFFNLVTLAVGYKEAAVLEASITDAGNGWRRCSMMVTAPATQTSRIQFMPVANPAVVGGGTYTGDGSSGVFVWGPQREVGSLTSYIPTSAAAITRNADVATITGADFSAFWRAVKGSALVRARPSMVSGVRPLLQFDNATADNVIALRGNGADAELYVRYGGVDQAQIDAGTIAANTRYRLAGAWATNDCAASFNSGAPVLDGVATIPTVTQARLGSDGTNYLNGHIEAIEYYDERVPSASLQVLSSQAGRNSIIGSVFRDSIIS